MQTGITRAHKHNLTLCCVILPYRHSVRQLNQILIKIWTAINKKRKENITNLSQPRLSDKCTEANRVSGVRFQMTTDMFHLLPPVTFIVTNNSFSTSSQYMYVIHCLLMLPKVKVLSSYRSVPSKTLLCEQSRSTEVSETQSLLLSWSSVMYTSLQSFKTATMTGSHLPLCFLTAHKAKFYKYTIVTG